MRKQIKRLSSIACAMVLLFSLSACKQAKEETPQAEADKAVPVETVKVTKGNIVEKKEFTGKLKPLHEITVGLKLPGRVKSVKVDVGDTVKEGDLLMEIDTSDVDLQVKQAQAAYNTAKVNKNTLSEKKQDLEEQKKELEDKRDELQKNIDKIKEGLKEQLDQGQIPQGVYDQQVAALNPSKVDIQLKKLEQDYLDGNLTLDQYNQMTQPLNLVKALNGLQQQIGAVEQAKAALPSAAVTDAQVKQAVAAVNLAKGQLKNAKVYSPVSGTVASRNVDKGEIASQAMPPFVIIDMSKMILEIQVTDFDVVHLKKGDETSIAVDALNGETFEGKISAVSPVPDQRTGNYPVKIELENPDHSLKAGMFARVNLESRRSENVVRVPADTIIDEGGQKIVFINKSGAAHKAIVETGLTDGTMVEITKGLSEGDELITKGQEFLAEGASIQVKRGES